tara:strand:- start:5990 stop:6394 length:405 start_codon:yes stop_codon:yes gene_type:complete
MGVKEIGMAGAVIVVVIILASAISAFMNGDSTSATITGNAVADVGNGEYQEVILSFVNYEYVVTPPSVEAGVPVKMVADLDTLYGCMRAVRIPSLGVSKYIKEGDNVIEFTADSPGTYTITCSMGMGVGELIVE